LMDHPPYIPALAPNDLLLFPFWRCLNRQLVWEHWKVFRQLVWEHAKVYKSSWRILWKIITLF